MLHPDTLDTVFTAATLVCAALKMVPIVILGLRKDKADDMFSSPVRAALYFTSKASGILVVAFALAAAASAGKAVEAYALTAVLVIATALTCWTIFARITGRFYGLARIGRPA